MDKRLLVALLSEGVPEKDPDKDEDKVEEKEAEGDAVGEAVCEGVASTKVAMMTLSEQQATSTTSRSNDKGLAERKLLGCSMSNFLSVVEEVFFFLSL